MKNDERGLLPGWRSRERYGRWTGGHDSLAALAVALVSLVCGTACSASSSASSLPPRVVVDSIVCDADRALLLGAQRGDSLPGDPKLFTQEAVAFRVHADDLSARRSAIGPGFVTSSSRTREGVVYVVRVEWFPDKPERGHLMRTTDFGESWAEVGSAPEDIIGAVFESVQSGYAWSSQLIYHTEDGGKTWSSVDAPRPLTRGRPRPAVSPSGDLWLAIGHGPGWSAEYNLVARVTPDLHVERVLSSLALRIGELALADGTPWVLAEVPDGGHAQVLRLSAQNGSHQLTTVGEFPPSLPEYLGVRGPDVVAALTDMSDDAPRDFLMVSEDAGASWRRASLPESRVSAYCAVEADEIWMVGSSGRIYAPR